jgi:hypothetical protein
MARNYSNVDITTDSFESWVIKTNNLLTALRDEIITANSVTGNTFGDAQLFGVFGANTLVATDDLRGGNVAASANLYISSNVNIGIYINGSSTSASLYVQGNTEINAASVIIKGGLLNVSSNAVFGGSFLNSSANVTVTGGNLNAAANLNVGGAINVAGNVSLTNSIFRVTSNTTQDHVIIKDQANVTIDSGTLFVDAVNNRVGINNTSPTQALTVTGNVVVSQNVTAQYFIGDGSMLSGVSGGSGTTYDLLTLSNTSSANVRLKSASDSNDDVKFVGGGISTVTSNGTVITITSTEADTLQSVTTRGATTNAAVVFNNTVQTGNLTVIGFINVTANVSLPVLRTGNVVIVSNTRSVSNTSVNIVDSFPKAEAQCVKYVVFVKDSTTIIHSIEALLVHDNTNVLLTQYAEIFNTSLGVFDADINNANVEFKFTATGASGANTYTVKVARTALT